MTRCRTIDAGQAPMVTYSGWLTPTKAVKEQEPGADGGGKERAAQGDGAVAAVMVSPFSG